jgi:hypothetical protein
MELLLQYPEIYRFQYRKAVPLLVFAVAEIASNQQDVRVKRNFVGAAGAAARLRYGTCKSWSDQLNITAIHEKLFAVLPVP